MAIGSTSAVERRRSSATRVKLRGPLAEAATLPRPSRSILGGQPATPRTTSSLSSSGATSEGAPSIARPGHTPRRPAQPTRARTAIIGASSASSTSSWVRATVTLRILQQQQPKGRHEGHAERIDAEIGVDEKARDERHAAWPAPPRCPWPLRPPHCQVPLALRPVRWSTAPRCVWLPTADRAPVARGAAREPRNGVQHRIALATSPSSSHCAAPATTAQATRAMPVSRTSIHQSESQALTACQQSYSQPPRGDPSSELRP